MLLATLNQSQKETLIHLAHSVVVSDGEFATGEELMMDAMRREMELPTDYESHYRDTDGIEDIFDTRKSRIIATVALVRLGYADGAFEIEEQSYLSTVCEKFEIEDKDFNRLENWVRRQISLEKELSDLL